MRMLDLFCGRFGWGRAFAARGWEVLGVDLIEPPEVPLGCRFFSGDVLDLHFRDGNFWLDWDWPLIAGCGLCLGQFDFICASSPCEKFAVHGLRCFFPNPPHPDLGITLFDHTRQVCEQSGLPYVMENVRTAQKFVGEAAANAGSFYLWGNAVPPNLPKCRKGFTHDGLRDRVRSTRKESIAAVATIPPELANCVADYAERLLEVPA